jgi:hypothetical protein
MTRIVCLTGTHNIGISFMDWSIHWLAGHDQVYHWQQGWQPITVNPLTRLNAHGHTRNHVSGIHNTRHVLDKLINVPADFHVIYPVGPAVDTMAQELGHTSSVLHDNQEWTRLIDLCDQEYAQVWRWCDYMGCDCVFVATDHHNQVYHAGTLDRAQHAVMFEETPVANTFLHMNEVFFNSTLSSATTVWDRRELLALNLQWTASRLGHEHLDFTLPHHWINCQEFWYHGQQVLSRLCKDLDITTDSSRWESWQQVYQKWQQINYQLLKFQYELDHIVDAVVNNWYYPLRDLSFTQEVIILHQLMHKHQLNVKNWQLEHFPDNTQKLHQLLEPNHHVLGRSTA